MVEVGRDFFGNRDDAEDVAQDALVRLWRYCERLDTSRNMETLTLMVTKNICIEKYKRRQHSIMAFRQTEDKLMNEAASKADQADAGIISEEAQQMIETAINSLSPREQELVRKRYLEDQSTEEIAQETGIPKPSVKSMLSMAKAKLKKRLRR